MGDDLRERIARAIEDRRDSHSRIRIGPLKLTDWNEGHKAGFLIGLQEAASIARDTHDEPATPDHLLDAYRAIAAQSWAASHDVGDPDVAFMVVDVQAREKARRLADAGIVKERSPGK